MNPSRLLRRLVLVNEGEIPALLWSAAYFFCLLSSYYILRPVRETMGIDRGADKLPWLMAGTMAAMFLANPLFSWLVSRMPRRRFIPLTYRFFIVNILVFYALMIGLPDRYRTGLGYAFYIWVSVFNLFAVSVFWSFLADVFTTEQGKRLFGFIGVGGTLGGIVGPAVTAGLVKHIGTFSMLLFSAVLLELAVRCVGRLARIFGLDPGAAPAAALRARSECPSCGYAREGPPASNGVWECPECGARSEIRPAAPLVRAGSKAREPGPGVLAGVGIVARSPYMLLICAYLFLYAVQNTFLYMEQGRVVDAALKSREARTAVFATMDMWTNVVTITLQLLLAGRLIRWLGVGVTLALLPALSAVGFAALWIISGREGTDAAAMQTALYAVMAFQITRRGVHYAVSQPTRQILFTGLGPDEIYKSKPFIDTFVYRIGDLAGAFAPGRIVAVAGVMGLTAAAAVPAAAIPIALVSLGVGLVLGMMQKRQGRANAPQEGAMELARPG